jgi:Mn-dependent DtxR family transcriptional regulator
MPPSSRAQRLAQLERAHARRLQRYTPREEDYVEVIYELMREKGYARAVDISANLHVRSPSVTRMLQKLHASDLLVYERYRGIMLTEKGERLAKSVRERHGILVRFLRLLGVNPETAHRDAEGLEHSLHPATIERLSHLVRVLEDNPAWVQTVQPPAVRDPPRGQN